RDRHRDLARDAGEARRELDLLVAHLQLVHGRGRDVERDLAVPHVLRGHLRARIDLDREMRGVAVVHAPLVERAKEIRLGGDLLHYFLITFSDGVSASMKAGREKMRSAYFMSGAAGLPSLMP